MTLLIKSPQGCGVGRGAECCAYLLAGAKGFECGRVDPELKAYIEGRVQRGTYNAKRLPVEPFNECQIYAAR